MSEQINEEKEQKKVILIDKAWVDDAITEIESKANSGQFSEGVGYGLMKAAYIVRKHIGDA